MKIFFLALALFFAASSAHSQALVPLPELTHLEDFSLRSGTVIQREFTRIGDFSNIRVDVVKVTDLIAKFSVQGVRISGSVGQGASRDTAFVDADEIDTFIRAIGLMKTSAFATTPDNFTDIVYRTRGGLAIGALYANKRWNIYIRLDPSDTKTFGNIDQNEVESLRDLLSQAKERLK